MRGNRGSRDCGHARQWLGMGVETVVVQSAVNEEAMIEVGEAVPPAVAAAGIKGEPSYARACTWKRESAWRWKGGKAGEYTGASLRVSVVGMTALEKDRSGVMEVNTGCAGLQPWSCATGVVGKICPSKGLNIQGVEVVVASWAMRSIHLN